jgi:hypothetical protein
MANTPQKPTREDVTTGANPLLADMPVVTANGVDYPLRRLGIADVFRTVRILGIGSRVAGLDMTEIVNAEDVAGALTVRLLAILPFAETQIMEMLADVLQVTPEQFADPDLFPMECIVDVIKAVAAHPDLTSFFTRLTELLPSMLASPETTDATANASETPSA